MAGSGPCFGDRLAAAVGRACGPIVVGLDPHLDLLPPEFGDEIASGRRDVVAGAVERFCSGILDAVAEVAAAVKPQVAFFERLGPPGWAALERLVASARERGLLVIADAKRGDIGSTAAAYADYLLGDAGGLGGLDADALTVNPYLGSDSLAPFLDRLGDGKGLFVLAKTSNPSSSELQDRILEGSGRTVYAEVATLARRLGRDTLGSSGYSSVGIVVGATAPEQAVELRRAFPELWFLVPGYGAQGGGASDVVGCFDSAGSGALVSASRSVLFAWRRAASPDEWARAAEEECRVMGRDLEAAVADRLAGDDEAC